MTSLAAEIFITLSVVTKIKFVKKLTKVFQKLVLIGVHGNLGELVPRHVTKKVNLNRLKIGIDA